MLMITEEAFTMAKIAARSLLPSDHFKGSLKATVMLLEYGDFECHRCVAAFHTLKDALQWLDDSVCFVFRHFPDIERHSHALSAAQAAEAAGCQVLVVPHHGSRTSSTPGFVDAVSPTIGLISVGHRSRFRHPNDAVVQRYAERGIVLRRTDVEGALHVVLPADSMRGITVAGHAEQVRYWRERRRIP
jgi:hypothetical protein